MKLILENWRQYIEKGDPSSGTPWERGGPYMDTTTVKIVEGPMQWGHYLFVVVEYEYPIKGKKKKVGLYRSSGSSISDTEHTRGLWFPVGGIGNHPKTGNPWIIKYTNKYPHPDSELGQVAKQVSKLIPPSEGERIRRAGVMDMHRQRREQGVQMSDIEKQQKDIINTAFSKHGVYDETPS